MSAEKQKDPISQALRAEKENIITLGTRLFQCPEPGFQEVESGKILASFLLQENIKVEKGIAFTGLKASIGKEGGYHIVLAADMDALYVNQGTGRYPFHSCGHSIQTSVMAYVLKILKDLQIPEKTGGKVSFLATPAEEFIDFDYRNQLIKEGKIRYYSGKQNMIADGVFDDADCVISMHINGETGTLFDVGSTLAGFLAQKVTFHGKASHSGAAPHLGRNALHAASLCMNAIAFMKDQFAREDGVSIHPVLTSSGGSVNVIPDRASFTFDIRSASQELGSRAMRMLEELRDKYSKKIEIEIIPAWEDAPVLLDSTGVRDIEELCRKLGLSYRIMTSGAGHDSQNMAQVYPTNVIFVPSEDGVSHDEREFTKPEDLQAGLTILSAYLKKLCWE